MCSEEIIQCLRGEDDCRVAGDTEKQLQTSASLSLPLTTGPAPQTRNAPPPTSSSLSRSRFAPLQSDHEIEQKRKEGIPRKTLQDTKFCLNTWEAWREHRKQNGHAISPLTEMTEHELQHWLTRFILEVRKKDGSVYPPNTLLHICAGLMRHLRWSGKPHIDIFKDKEFANFRASLDAEMKRLQSLGVGSKKKQAEVLSREDEELLWEKDLLGDATPQSLVDTILFYNGLYFALRSGNEHRQLRNNPCQIDLVERPGERSYLKYTEDVSKNHPGGLKGRKLQPKVVLHHANVENPKRCFVRLFKRYRELCPKDAPAHAFYLKPSRTPSPMCWYYKYPLGHVILDKTVNRLCELAGINGYKTNHSLRATATSRLYQSGVDEQLVMERTGHRSLKGVRSYKRTSDSQRENISDILNGSEKTKLDSVALSTSQTVTSTLQCSSQLRTLSLPSATFHQCTVNFNIGSAPQTEPRKRKKPMILDSDSDYITCIIIILSLNHYCFSCCHSVITVLIFINTIHYIHVG